MGAWDVVEETEGAAPAAQPPGEWDVAEEKSTAAPDISLWEGVKDLGKTAVKSVGGVPAALYQEARHPLDSAKTLYEGVKNIPGNMWEHAKGDVQSVRDDIAQAKNNPDLWQKTLHGGRAALSTVGAPFDVLVGAPYESTVGQLAQEGSGGAISAQDASFLPMLLAGRAGIPKAARAVDARLKEPVLQPLKVQNAVSKAAEVIAERFAKGEKAGSPSLKDAIEQVRKARESGKPLTLADVGGENVRGLAGYVSRAPGGPSREIARNFLDKRDTEAGGRLTQDIDTYLAQGSVLKTAQDLAEQRSVESKPLFEEAYRGGSMAPLEQQFKKSFDDSVKQVDDVSKEIQTHLDTIATLRKKLNSADAYGGQSKVGLHTELKHAEAALGAAEIKLTGAQAEKASVLEGLRQAQNDKSFNTPGAVWNPNIARLMANPNLKKGIAKGLRIEKNLADAEGRPFNPREYAITGMDEAGEPVVGKVPNMKLLAAAKEGLDDILQQEGMRDKLTGRLTKEGVSVDKLRRALLGELDTVNPAYKTARAQWAGHSRSMEALKWGREIFNGKPEELAAEMDSMAPAEREFARLGAADIIREKVLRTGFSGDEAKAIIKSEWAKKQLRPLFESEENFNKFVQAVTDERNMFEARGKIIGNSATAERVAEDTGNAAGLIQKGVKTAKDLAAGNHFKLLNTLVDLWHSPGLRNNPKLNEAIAKMLFDPNVNIEQFGAFTGVKK